MEVADIAEAKPLAEGDNHGSDTRSAAARFDDLVRVLEAAADAFRRGATRDREEAFADGLAALTALYRSLDDRRSDVTAPHLDRVYDATLRALSDAYAGETDALVAATAMARCIRSVLAPAPATARPSRPVDVERRAA